MQDVQTRVVRDLGADARSILETMLGRKLAEEEQVTVMAFAPRPAPPEDERRIAAQRLSETLDAMSECARHIPEREMEALIDEAMEHVRPRRP
jgi:hypothetical protein